MSARVVADENAACDDCVYFGTLEMGGRKLCAECVILADSNCGGPGGE
jgi:hypothetical protein